MRASLPVFAVLLLLAPAAAGEWLQFHGDALRTGFASGSLPAPPAKWWATSLGSAIEAGPVVSGGRVFVGTLDGKLHALDAVLGERLWTFESGSAIVGSPALSGGVLYLVTSAGKLFALDAATGKVRVRAGTGSPDPGPSVASPALHQGRLYVSTEAGAVIAYNLQTLTKDWEYQPTQEKLSYESQPATNVTPAVYGCASRGFAAKPIRTSPAVVLNKVFVGSDLHYLFALDEFGLGGAGAGKTMGAWTENGTEGAACQQALLPQLGDVVRASPAVDFLNGLVVVASYDNTVRAYQASDGAERWNVTLSREGRDSRVIATPAVHNGTAYVGSFNGRFYALETIADAPYVRERWNFTAGDAIWSSPAVADGKVVFGSDDEHLYVLDAVDGRLLWRLRTGGDVRSSPAVVDGVVYVGSSDGTLHAYGGARPALADLWIAQVQVPEPLFAGEEANVTVDVWNIGTAASPATELRLRIGNLTRTEPLPALEPVGKASFAFPWKAALGEHTLEVLADPSNRSREADRANHRLTLAALAVARPPPPNLTRALEAETEAEPGPPPPPPPPEGPGLVWLALPALAAVGLTAFALWRRRAGGQVAEGEAAPDPAAEG